MSDAAIGRLRFGATSAREVSVTRGRRLPSIRSAAVRVALFLPDVVGWSNLFNSLRQYTAKITAFSRHFVSRTFENIELNSRTIEGT